MKANSKENQRWIDDAIDGKEPCPECGDELKDQWCATAQISWLECDCGFDYVYEKG